MTGTPQLAWTAIKEYYEENKNDACAEMTFDNGSMSNFVNLFTKKYDEVMDRFMDDSVESLDRHKQASILILCTIECKVLSPIRRISEDEIFIGEQQIAFLLGLSYMKDRLNEILEANGQKPIEKYQFPNAFSCATEYFDILTRDLYLQTHKDDSVYILFLSHVLFLIEYYTIKELGVDMNVLREQRTNTN